MKIEALKEYIRKVVQDEVRNVLKEELKHQLAEIILGGNTTTSIKKTRISKDLEDESILEESTEEIVQQEPSKPKKFVKYTNNDVLNQILNETKGGIPQEGGMVSMMGGSPSTQSESILENKIPDSASTEVKGVYQAFSRDYRSLLKAVDKKRSNKV